MTELEWLKTKKKDFDLNHEDSLCLLAYCAKYNVSDCKGACEDCEFFNFDKCVDYLLQEHDIPIKLKQWEYDLIKAIFDLSAVGNFEIKHIGIINDIKDLGFFKGIYDGSMKVKDILDNCIIVSDDYDFSEVK